MSENRTPYQVADLAALHMAQLCADAGLPQPEQEYKFHATRRWRFDYAWAQYKIALEVEGAARLWSRGNR